MQNEAPLSTSKPSYQRFVVIGLLVAAICIGMCGLLVIFLYRVGTLNLNLTMLPPTPIYPSSLNSGDVNTIISQATTLMKQGNYSQALPLWDEVIAQMPDSDVAHYQRAVCYYNLLPREHSLQQYEFYSRSALADMDKAISLQPRNGDYYSFRHDVIITFADWEEYRVNRQAILLIAHDDIKAAIAYGYTPAYRFTDRVNAADMIALEQCDQGLAETQRILQSTATNDTSITGLYRMEAEAYECLGRLDEAVQAIDAALHNPDYVIEKSYQKAAYLYQAGRLDEALSVLNDSFDKKPLYQGYRYYLRALIYYETGKKDLATADLQTGSLYTWEHQAVYAYVNGKMALDAGQRDEGIRDLQMAEATLDFNFLPLRSRIQKELAQLGAEPLSITPSINITATPIPINPP